MNRQPPPRLVNKTVSTGRKFSPELLRLSPAPVACTCRVCAKPIAEAEASWGWIWRSYTRGCLSCGWYRLDDHDAVSALKALGDFKTPPSITARTRAHELFLVQCTTTHEHDRSGTLREVKNWRFSAIGIALLRLVRAEAQAAE